MKIAIQGHPTRGKEIIQILESLGGKNNGYYGNNPELYYEIYGNSIVAMFTKNNNYKYYTLEEFEKEFPFKIGDKVTVTGTKHPKIITGITNTQWGLRYVISEIKFPDSKEMPHISRISLYKEMNEERNITLTLDKAKEWYKKGGELKEVALQAYSEEELTKAELPKSWEEYCNNYPVKANEAMIACDCTIIDCTKIKGKREYEFKDIMPSKKSAEAHLALMQLEQLRDCYRQEDMPDFNNDNIKYCIVKINNCIKLKEYLHTNRFLSFNRQEVAEEFLNNFKSLIKIAEDYI